MTCTSRFSMGMASSRSSALPWGMPSTTSISTTSASSLAAIQCAAFAPTFPAPTTVTFLRMSLLSSSPSAANLLHVFDHSRCELAGLNLGGALHLTLEVVSHELLLDGLLHGRFDEPGGLTPAKKFQQHDAGEHDGAGIDDVLVRILGRGAMRGFKDCVAIADVRAGRDAQPSHLRRSRVRDVVPIQIWGGEDAVVLGTDDDLLEDGVGDAVVDHHLLLPLACAVRFADLVENGLDLGTELLPEGFGDKLESGLDQCGVLLDGQIGIRFEIAEDPALALGHGLVAEFVSREF